MKVYVANCLESIMVSEHKSYTFAKSFVFSTLEEATAFKKNWEPFQYIIEIEEVEIDEAPPVPSYHDWNPTDHENN